MIKLKALAKIFIGDWKALVVTIFATLVFAFSVANFTMPYRLPDVGVVGLSVLASYRFGVSPNWTILIVNAALLVWGARTLNKRFMFLTLVSTLTVSFGISLFSAFPLDLRVDKFMAAVIAGFLKGASIGMMFNVGGSSGGFDIVAAVLLRRYGLEVGKFSSLVNFVILALSMSVVGLESVVYGVVSVYVNGEVLDNTTRSFDKRKQAIIITNKPAEVSKFINSWGRGVTELEGKGTYTGKTHPVLLSLLNARQIVMLKSFLKEEDPKAFVSICDASEVLGQGFKSWRSL